VVVFCLTNCLTNFCSSMRNALTIRSLTQFAQREPPYARCTVFSFLARRAYSRGRRAGIYRLATAIFKYRCIQDSSPRNFNPHQKARKKDAREKQIEWRASGSTPGSLMPQSPHLGPLPGFLMCRYLSFPPGVLMTRVRFERVLSRIQLARS
jgi:hypothetical protein